MMSTKFIASSIALVLSAGSFVPAFAYMSPVYRQMNTQDVQAIARYDRPTRRDVQMTAKRDVPTEMKTRMRLAGTLETQATHQQLSRGRMDRNFRRENRLAKAGHDRYRIMNRPSSHFFASVDSNLPVRIVQTGGVNTYDKPTRRDIRDNGFSGQITNRKRNVLGERMASLSR